MTDLQLLGLVLLGLFVVWLVVWCPAYGWLCRLRSDRAAEAKRRRERSVPQPQREIETARHPVVTGRAVADAATDGPAATGSPGLPAAGWSGSSSAVADPAEADGSSPVTGDSSAGTGCEAPEPVVERYAIAVWRVVVVRYALDSLLDPGQRPAFRAKTNEVLALLPAAVSGDEDVDLMGQAAADLLMKAALQSVELVFLQSHLEEMLESEEAALGTAYGAWLEWRLQQSS